MDDQLETDLGSIEEMLARKVVFRCSPRGGGSETRDIPVTHSGYALDECAKLPGWLPRSLRAILNGFGVLRLFHPEHDVNDGFRLFSPEDYPKELELFRSVFENAAPYMDEDDLAIARDNASWVNGLRPIGEVVESGDIFVLDTGNAGNNGECPVMFLDHEMYYAGFIEPDDDDVVAQDVVELISRILNDPLEFLDATWTGGDPGVKWFPDSVIWPD